MTSPAGLPRVTPADLTITGWNITEGTTLPDYGRPWYGTVAFHVTRTISLPGGWLCSLRFDDFNPSWHILRVPLPLPRGVADLETSAVQFLARELGVNQDLARDITAAVLPQGLAGDLVTREEFSVTVHLNVTLEKLDAVSEERLVQSS